MWPLPSHSPAASPFLPSVCPSVHPFLPSVHPSQPDSWPPPALAVAPSAAPSSVPLLTRLLPGPALPPTCKSPGTFQSLGSCVADHCRLDVFSSDPTFWGPPCPDLFSVSGLGSHPWAVGTLHALPVAALTISGVWVPASSFLQRLGLWVFLRLLGALREPPDAAELSCPAESVLLSWPYPELLVFELAEAPSSSAKRETRRLLGRTADLVPLPLLPVHGQPPSSLRPLTAVGLWQRVTPVL